MWAMMTREGRTGKSLIGNGDGPISFIVNGEVRTKVSRGRVIEWTKYATPREMLSGALGLSTETPDGPRTFYPPVLYMMGAPAFDPPDYLVPYADPRTDRYLVMPPLALPGKCRKVLDYSWCIEHWDNALCQWTSRTVTPYKSGDGAVIPLGGDIGELTVRLTLEGVRVVTLVLCTGYTGYQIVLTPFTDYTIDTGE